MAISSNTLFHFTKQRSTVVSILRSKGFWPKYCIEYGWKKKFAVSQCCFCDIPLANVTPHMNLYGNFGIGMTKEWGIEKKLSPVLYVIKDSYTTNVVRKILNNAKNAGADIKNEEARLISMMKIFQGVNYRYESKKVQYKNYMYYNEREWRYVPELKGKKQIMLIENECDFESRKSVLDASTECELCSFTPSDIKYLLVNDINDRKLLIVSIDAMNYSNEEKELLKSKIIENELIREDI